MSTASPSVAAAGPSARSGFFRARLASAFGILPLGVWTFFHLWHNLAAFTGAEAWQSAVTEYPHPIAQALTGIVVLLPLVLHAIWGIGRMATSRPNNVRYGFYANLKYLLQRLAGVGLLGFLGAHLWLALLKPRMLEGHPESFADLAEHVHFHWPTLATYVLGILAVAFHMANGLQSFCMGWGVVTSQKGLRRLEGAALLVFLLLLGMGWGAVYALWAAGAAAPT